MSARVQISIYVLSSPVSTQNLTQQEKARNKIYLNFLDTTHITRQNTIWVGSENIPSSFPGITSDFYEVQTDADGDKFISVTTNQSSSLVFLYYIKDTPGESISKKIDKNVAKKFDFYLNPEKITPVYRKLTTELRTRGGWDIQHWGNALTEVKVDGKTGSLLSPGITDLTKYDITTSEAWKRLSQLRDLYYQNNAIPTTSSEISFGMTYFDRFYIGYFSDFRGPDGDAQYPFLMNYGFTFKVIDEISIPK